MGSLSLWLFLRSLELINVDKHYFQVKLKHRRAKALFPCVPPDYTCNCSRCICMPRTATVIGYEVVSRPGWSGEPHTTAPEDVGRANFARSLYVKVFGTNFIGYLIRLIYFLTKSRWVTAQFYGSMGSAYSQTEQNVEYCVLSLDLCAQSINILIKYHVCLCLSSSIEHHLNVFATKSMDCLYQKEGNVGKWLRAPKSSRLH